MTRKVLVIAAALLLVAALTPGVLDAQIVRDTIYRQNFDSTWSTTAPPTGWAIIYTDGDASGSEGNNDWRRAQQSGTDYYAYLYYYPSNTSTDRLISPVLDCSDSRYQSVWVQVWTYWSRYSTPYTAQIRGSSDGGTTFPEILLDYAGNRAGTIDVFDISSFALGQNDVCIDFYGDGYIWNINYWYVDDFMVYGEWVEGGGGGDSIDLQMAQIMRPLSEEQGGVSFAPACKVFNITADTVLGDVECKFTDISNMQVVYDKVLNDFEFVPGYNTVQAFPGFTPEGGKKYKALFVVTNPDDVDHSNDDKSLTWSAVVGVEVSPTEILAPSDPQVNAFAPKAVFVEKAGKAEANVWMHYKLEGPTLATMEDSTSHDFEANEADTVEFGMMSDLAEGNYTITFWTTDKGGTRICKPESGLSKDFGYSGIVDNPEPVDYELSISGGVVSFTLPVSTNVSLKVYDASGQVVSTLAMGSMSSGSHTLSWTGNPGVYFVKLMTPEHSVVKKATIVK